MGPVTWTREEWIEEQLEGPLYGGKALIAVGWSDFFEDDVYFEFDCFETFEVLRTAAEEAGHTSHLAAVDVDDLPDEFEVFGSYTASDIPCEVGRCHLKDTWLWANADDETVIAVDEGGSSLHFVFENDVTWDFFRGIAESRYGVSLRRVPHDELPELFVVADEWCEYDI